MSEILGLYMSPRRQGNSDLLLDEFLRGAAESGVGINRIYTRDLDVEGCIECGGCDETGECIIQDDMDELYPLLINAKYVVAASSIFFYGLPAKAKAFVDRSQALWNRVRLNPQLARPDGRGFFIGVGATKGKNLFEGTLLTMKYFYDALGLPAKVEELTYRRVEGKGAVRDHPTALRDVFAAGVKFGKEIK
ncbi:MAG: flavodoxin family protein [Pseudomonadota bacterium]